MAMGSVLRLTFFAAIGCVVGIQIPTIRSGSNGKFGDKKLVVITGTSSGLGRSTARALLQTGQ